QGDGGQVLGQGEQVVAQGLGHELVDLVAHLPGDAAHDRTGGLFRSGTAGRVGQRVEECGDQADLLVGGGTVRIGNNVEVGVEPIHRLGQHGVTEAVDGVRELGHDRRV